MYAYFIPAGTQHHGERAMEKLRAERPWCVIVDTKDWKVSIVTWIQSLGIQEVSSLNTECFYLISILINSATCAMDGAFGWTVDSWCRKCAGQDVIWMHAPLTYVPNTSRWMTSIAQIKIKWYCHKYMVVRISPYTHAYFSYKCS